MNALIYIVHAVFQYLLVAAFLLRLLLPLMRANMRNPLSQGVLRVTNPLVMPLRSFLPPLGRVDTASVVALLIVQTATTAIILLLRNLNPSDIGFLLRNVGFDLAELFLQLFRFAIFIYALLSWIAPAQYSPATDVLSTLCDPPLRLVRRVIPPVGGFDLSPVFLLIALTALLMLLPSIFL